MNLIVKDICQKINGVGKGNLNAIISSTAGIEKTTNKSICYLDDIKFEKIILSGNIKSSVILIQTDLIKKLSLSIDEILIKNYHLESIVEVKNAKESFAFILSLFTQDQKKNQIEKPSYIDGSATIGKKIYIGAFSYIDQKSEISNYVKIFPNCYIGKNVQIGKNTIIYAGVKIYDNTKIKSNCIIHSGAVIGADGFGFISNAKNIKIPHHGNVIIQNNVEIGANTCVDRGKTHTDSTILESGVKLDNLVQIGHNVVIGQNTMIAGCTGIAGSTTIGKNCLIGGKVAIADHINIADNIKIAGNSGVTKSFNKKGIILQGPIAFEQKEFQKSYIHFKNKSKKI